MISSDIDLIFWHVDSVRYGGFADFSFLLGRNQSIDLSARSNRDGLVTDD